LLEVKVSGAPETEMASLTSLVSVMPTVTLFKGSEFSFTWSRPVAPSLTSSEAVETTIPAASPSSSRAIDRAALSA